MVSGEIVREVVISLPAGGEGALRVMSFFERSIVSHRRVLRLFAGSTL